jgi:hypothetical protein
MSDAKHFFIADLPVANFVSNVSSNNLNDFWDVAFMTYTGTSLF